MDKKEVKLYCMWCGRKLVYRKKKLIYYNRNTGEPRWQFIYTCPMRRYLMFWHGVATFMRDEDGELQEVYVYD